MIKMKNADLILFKSAFFIAKYSIYNFILLANKLVLTIPKTTTVTELKGIKIAAITGSNKP